MSDILTLTETEARILDAMIVREEFDKKGNSEGVTSYRLSKNDNAIPIATWNDHYKKLEYNKMIMRRNVKQNKRKSKPYSVTPLGFFALLRYLKQEEIKQKVNLVHFSKFIPLISKNWEELEKIYSDKVLIEILKYSLTQIKLESQNIEEEEDEDIPLFDKHIFQTINFEFDEQKINISYWDKFGFYTDEEYEKLADTVHKNKESKDILLMTLSTPRLDLEHFNYFTDKITFLFYFNFVKYTYDKIFFSSICEIPESIENLTDCFKEIDIQFNKIKKTQKNLIKIIQETDLLKGLFSEEIQTIDTYFKKPKIILELNQKFKKE